MSSSSGKYKAPSSLSNKAKGEAAAREGSNRCHYRRPRAVEGEEQQQQEQQQRVSSRRGEIEEVAEEAERREGGVDHIHQKNHDGQAAAMVSEERGGRGGADARLLFRADRVNLAELDAALERVRRVMSCDGLGPADGRVPGGTWEGGGGGGGMRRSRSSAFIAASSQDPLLPARQRLAAARPSRQPWEIDPSKLLLKYLLGKGTFGTVYRGTLDGQEVAAKLLDWGEEGSNDSVSITRHRDTLSKSTLETVRTAFMQEVLVWMELDHPNVTKFIGALIGDTKLKVISDNQDDIFDHVSSDVGCVVLEYVPGGSLRRYLDRHFREKLPLRVVLHLALDLAKGLQYLHSKDIVHRDIKSDNILLDKNTNLKITDFGVARVEAKNPKDMTGGTGTLTYMAPEVFYGKPYDRKCDVFSFGIVLWEIYCCDTPRRIGIKSLSSKEFIKELCPPIPRCCPKSLAAIIKKCCKADPDKRPTMEDVVAMLEKVDVIKGRGMTPLDEPQGCCAFFKHS